MHDVTEERKSAEAALQARKLESIGTLAQPGSIARDFNNLLTSILGNVSLAMAGLAENDPTRPLLDIAERSSLKAAALVAQLLAFAGRECVVHAIRSVEADLGDSPAHFRLRFRNPVAPGPRSLLPGLLRGFGRI